MRPDYQRALGWLIPMTCIVAAALVLNAKRADFVEASTRRDLAMSDVLRAGQEEKDVASQPQERRFAAADAEDREETQFLDELRTRAASAGATIVGWTSESTTYGKDEAADAKVDESVKGLTKVSCNLTLDGKYGDLRRFVKNLSDSDRLFTVSQIAWKRLPNGTELAMTLGRYVAPSIVSARPKSP